MKTSILLFFFLILQSCASISEKNPEINLNKELNKYNGSFCRPRTGNYSKLGNNHQQQWEILTL